MKFLARIEYDFMMSREAKLMGDKNIHYGEIEFTLQDLVDQSPLFDIREILIPWLRKGNIPILVKEQEPQA